MKYNVSFEFTDGIGMSTYVETIDEISELLVKYLSPGVECNIEVDDGQPRDEDEYDQADAESSSGEVAENDSGTNTSIAA